MNGPATTRIATAATRVSTEALLLWLDDAQSRVVLSTGYAEQVRWMLVRDGLILELHRRGVTWWRMWAWARLNRRSYRAALARVDWSS